MRERLREGEEESGREWNRLSKSVQWKEMKSNRESSRKKKGRGEERAKSKEVLVKHGTRSSKL